MAASAAFLSFQENDLDRAEADVGRGRSTTYLDVVERNAPYAVRFDCVVLGDVTVGRLVREQGAGVLVEHVRVRAAPEVAAARVE